MIGRENFDYVTIEAYAADMADLSAQAAAAINNKEQDLAGLQRLIWLLVQAGGGSVKIPRHVVQDYDRATALITVEQRLDDMSIVVSARR